MYDTGSWIEHVIAISRPLVKGAANRPYRVRHAFLVSATIRDNACSDLTELQLLLDGYPLLRSGAHGCLVRLPCLFVSDRPASDMQWFKVFKCA